VPSAIKTAREYGDDLAVVFFEVQGAGAEEAEQFAWQRKWMGTPAMWTSERLFRTGSRGIRNFALLSAEGEILMMGHPGSMHSKIKDAIESEIASAKKGPKDAPKALKGAYKAFGKSDYAKAMAAAQKVAAKGGDDAPAAEALAAEFTAAIAKKFARIDWLLKNGYVIESEELFEEVAGGVKGLDQKAVKKLGKFVEKNEGARVIGRANALLGIGTSYLDDLGR